MNDIDAARPIEEVRRLLTLAMRLGYRDEIVHWNQVLLERGAHS